jgi:hypothetical protein
MIQALPREPRHVELHRLVELIDGVVHPADLSDEAAIVGH